jgi:hypothetical protein
MPIYGFPVATQFDTASISALAGGRQWPLATEFGEPRTINKSASGMP